METKKMQDWEDFLRERMRKEDESVAQKFASWAYLGRGHLRTDLCRIRVDR